MVLLFRFWLQVDKKVAAIRRNGRKDFQTQEPKGYFEVTDLISFKYFSREDLRPGFPGRSNWSGDPLPFPGQQERCDLLYESKER